MRTDRACGLVCVVVAGLLYAVVIPLQVEPVDYGWLRPRTLPRALAVVIGLSGVALVIWPAGDARPGAVPWTRAALFGLVLCVSLALIAQVGFVYVAPVMAATIMMLAGERRPLWLGLGVVGLPLLIWVCVAVLLGRPLP